MNRAEVEARAADLIAERGWYRGWSIDDAGCMCPVGAMYVAVGVTPKPYRSFATVWAGYTEGRRVEVDQARLHLAGHIGEDVTRWNDDPARTRDEVITALREAAACDGRCEQ